MNVDDRYIVVTIDSHVGPPIEEYGLYCPPKHRRAFDEQVEEVRRVRAEGVTFSDVAKRSLGYTVSPEVVAAAELSNSVEGGNDSQKRLADMDADGIAGAVLFHGLQNGETMPLASEGLFQASTEPSELDAVGYHMYNQWVADFASADPDRYAAQAYVDLRNMDGALRELEWAADAGLRGVNFPAPKRDRPDYSDPYYDPFFAAAADLGMPLATHNGGGDRWKYDNGLLGAAYQRIEGPFVARRSVWQMIFSGVFERHPNLKVVLTEFLNAHWIEGTLRDMDAAILDRSNPIRQTLPKLPSEYWETNYYVGASFMSHDEACLYPGRGMRKLMWGDDYPHLEGTFPYTRDAMRKTFAGIHPEYVERMIGLNAAEAYGFDVARLRTVADQVGPTVEELSSAPSTVPGGNYVGHGFRDSSAWPAATVGAGSLAG